MQVQVLLSAPNETQLNQKGLTGFFFSNIYNIIENGRIKMISVAFEQYATSGKPPIWALVSDYTENIPVYEKLGD